MGNNKQTTKRWDSESSTSKPRPSQPEDHSMLSQSRRLLSTPGKHSRTDSMSRKMELISRSRITSTTSDQDQTSVSASSENATSSSPPLPTSLPKRRWPSSTNSSPRKLLTSRALWTPSNKTVTEYSSPVMTDAFRLTLFQLLSNCI